MSLKKISGFLAGPGGLLVLIFFFAPWVTVSCSTESMEDFLGTSTDDVDLITVSGYKLASGVTQTDYEEIDESELGDPFAGMEGFEGTGSTEESSEFDPEDDGFLSENGDPKLYFLLLAGGIGLTLALIGFVLPQAVNIVSGTLAYLAPGLLGLIILIFKFIEIERDIRKWNQEAFADAMGTGDTLPISPSADVLFAHYKVGFVMTFLGIVLLLAAGVLVFLSQEKTDDFAAARFTPTTSKGRPGGTGRLQALANNPASAAPQPISPPPVSPASPTIAPLSAPPASMEEFKAKMEQARELIKTKQYQEARNILKSVNHPKAKEWLIKLDELDPFGDL